MGGRRIEEDEEWYFVAEPPTYKCYWFIIPGQIEKVDCNVSMKKGGVRECKCGTPLDFAAADVTRCWNCREIARQLSEESAAKAPKRKANGDVPTLPRFPVLNDPTPTPRMSGYKCAVCHTNMAPGDMVMAAGGAVVHYKCSPKHQPSPTPKLVQCVCGRPFYTAHGFVDPNDPFFQEFCCSTCPRLP